MSIDQYLVLTAFLFVWGLLASRIIENWKSDKRPPWLYSIFHWGLGENPTYIKRNSRVILTAMYLASSLGGFTYFVVLLAIRFAPDEILQNYLQQLIENMNQ